MSTTELKDDSLMPFGKHSGKKMAAVPAYYLIWFKENHKPSQCGPLAMRVLRYCEENWDAILKENQKGSRK